MIFRPRYLQNHSYFHEPENPHVHGLMPSIRHEDDRFVVPKIFSGEKIRRNIFSKEMKSKDFLTKQPCSLDILIEEFTDKEGKPLPFPIKVPPEGEIIGLSSLCYSSFPNEKNVLCAETRSRYARRGFTCLGFQFSGTRPFAHDGAALNFLFKNYFGSPLLIPEPIAPVQVSETEYRENLFVNNLPLKLFKNDEDVTKKNETLLGNFFVYTTQLDEELVYFKKSRKAVDLLDQAAFEKLAVNARVDKIEEIKPDFCLTKTEEDIRTNGCPAYMFPFHYLDAVEKRTSLADFSLLSEVFYQIFSESRFLPVTANAGLINPGNSGRIVCENITKNRDLNKYFKAHQPFALVIPIPFHDGKFDNDSYQSERRHQEKIIF